MPTPRHDLQCIAVGGEVYAISGADDFTLDVVEIYDAARDSWRTGPSIPTARGWLGAALLDGKIYVGGGKTIRTQAEKEESGDDETFNPRDALEVLDLETQTWSVAKPSPSGRRAGVTLAAALGKVYIIGGNDMRGGGLFDAVDAYDPATGEWEEGPRFPYGLQGPNAIGVDDRIYVFGGLRQGMPREESYLVDVHVLDPKVGHWEKLAPMPTRRESMGITLMPDGRIFTCGGHHNLSEDTCEHYADCTEIYDIESDSWISEAPLPEGKAWLDAATVGDRIFAMGGAYKRRGPGFKWIDRVHEFVI